MGKLVNGIRCSVERYWYCSVETVHYKYNETVIFAVLNVQQRRL